MALCRRASFFFVGLFAVFLFSLDTRFYVFANLASHTESDVLSGLYDTFSTLSKEELEELSVDNGDFIDERLEKLAEFESVTFVDVKLVGFDGDGNEGLFMDAQAVSEHLHVSAI